MIDILINVAAVVAAVAYVLFWTWFAIKLTRDVDEGEEQ